VKIKCQFFVPKTVNVQLNLLQQFEHITEDMFFETQHIMRNNYRVTTFQTTWNSVTFPVEASKDYPVSSVCRYGHRSFHISY